MFRYSCAILCSILLAGFAFAEAKIPSADKKGARDNPSLKLLVVGHTDNVGTFDFNAGLSQRRAASVVAALTGQYGIAKARLTPVGLSFAAPVASNKSEEGRAKNRRVELVQN